MGGPSQQRRRYDSPVRRERAAQTRERIVTAGWELAHERPSWDWQGLTVRAVAERAGVNERTVYRHFPSERELHDAVLGRLEEEAGVTLEGLRLADVADVTARVFTHVSSFPLVPRAPREPTLIAADQRRREAVRHAVAAQVPGWPDTDRAMAAAVLDVLWSVSSYERLLAGWELTHEDAANAITWAIGLVAAAIKDGSAPSAAASHGREESGQPVRNN
jgi:AcrR family transcriptional regulator